jgi:hypothetical protein
MRNAIFASFIVFLMSFSAFSREEFPTTEQLGPRGWEGVISAQQERIKESLKKLQQAESAQGGERMKFMQEHMKMMEDHMAAMAKMMPPKKMSLQNHDKWMAEHEKMMQDLLDQMKREHAMMRQMMKP